MKLTINVDDALLKRVVAHTGCKTKTDAIHLALREIDRRARLVRTLEKGSGVAAKDLPHMFAPESDPVALRVADTAADYRGGGSEK